MSDANRRFARSNPTVVGSKFQVGDPPYADRPKGNILRFDAPQWDQWVLTLNPVQKRNGQLVYDYGLFAAAGDALVSGFPRATLTWGAGGARQSVTFDWPVAGGQFNITGESFQLDVECLSTGALTATSPGQRPVYSASMSPGRATRARQMTLTQVLSQVFGQASEQHPVPPFASGLQISFAPTSTAPRIVSFLDDNAGAVCMDVTTPVVNCGNNGQPALIPVLPCNAQALNFQGPNAAGTTTLFCQWLIGLE